MTEQATPVGTQLVVFYQQEPKKPSNAVGVELLPIAEASGFLLAGPAVVGTVYVRHPIDHRELIAFADYDEKLAQDRYREALRVFTKLGAARIVATSRRETSTQGGGFFGIKALASSFVVSRNAEWSLAFDQEGAGCAPVDPRPLRFPDEPMLDAVCEGVLRLGVKKGRIQITRSAKLGVDSELGVQLKKAGFALGISGSKVVATDFIIEAAFSPDVAKELDEVVAKADAEPLRRSPRRRRTSRRPMR